MSFSGWKGPRRIATLWKDIGRLLCASCNFYRPIMLCKWTYIVISKVCDCKEIKSVHLKRNLSWIFIGWIDAEAEVPILWPPDVKNWPIGKNPDAGKDWRQEEKGTTEDEMVGWHHRLNAHEFEQAPGGGEGQGGLACCSPWGLKESDTTEQLNNKSMNREYLSIHLDLLRFLT